MLAVSAAAVKLAVAEKHTAPSPCHVLESMKTNGLDL